MKNQYTVHFGAMYKNTEESIKGDRRNVDIKVNKNLSLVTLIDASENAVCCVNK